MTETIDTLETTAGPEAGNFLDREALAMFGSERKTEKLVVNGRGDFVYITELTGLDRDWYEKQVFRMENGVLTRDGDGVRAKMIVLGVTDQTGKKMFGRNEWQRLNGWSSSLQQRLFDAICDVSGISDKAKADFLANSEETDLED